MHLTWIWARVLPLEVILIGTWGGNLLTLGNTWTQNMGRIMDLDAPQIIFDEDCLRFSLSTVVRETAVALILSRKCTRNMKFADSLTCHPVKEICLFNIHMCFDRYGLSLATFGRECLRFSFSLFSRGETAEEGMR